MAYKAWKFLLPQKPQISVFNFIDTLPAMMDVIPLACTMAVTTDHFLMLWYVFLPLPCVCWLHAIFKTVCYCLLVPHHPHQNSWDLQMWDMNFTVFWAVMSYNLVDRYIFPTMLTFLSCSWTQRLPPKYCRSASMKTIIVMSTTVINWNFTCEGVCQTTNGAFSIWPPF